MAKIALRAMQTSTTTGVGTYSLGASAPYGWQKFLDDSNIVTTDQVYYLATDVDFAEETGNWEVGIGTITSASPDTISRDTLIDSSTGSWISWSTGTRNIVGIIPATGFMLGDNNLSELASPTTARTNLGLGTAATKDEGHGNTLDADTVDSFEGSVFVVKANDETITGANTFSGDQALSGDNAYTGKNDFSGTGGRVILPTDADSWA